jgi:hypothetical protein
VYKTPVFGSHARVGAGPLLVAEADESDRSFLLLRPQVAVVTNVDQEHLESYRDFEGLVEAFERFAESVPSTGAAVLCEDDPHLRAIAGRTTARVVTYGLEEPSASLGARDVTLDGYGSSAKIVRRTAGVEAALGTLSLGVPGRHNVANALAAIGVALELNVPFERASAALAQFRGAFSVTQFEVMPRPPEQENKSLVWPNWPLKLRTSSSHDEGCIRDWAVSTKEFLGSNGKVEKLRAVRVEWKDGKMSEIAGSEFELKADLVLLAMGFVSPAQKVLDAFGVEKDARGNIKADTENYRTSVDKVFAAGDMRRGQSLVVWAIREGRQCAHAIDKFLMGETSLPR